MMKSKLFTLEESQIKKLQDHYKTTGIRMSETVRRAIDLYFNQQKKAKNGTDKD